LQAIRLKKSDFYHLQVMAVETLKPKDVATASTLRKKFVDPGPPVKPKASKPRYSRATTMSVTICLTLVVFALDRILLEWSPGGSLPSLLEDPSLIFLVLGICASLFFLRGNDWSRATLSAKNEKLASCDVVDVTSSPAKVVAKAAPKTVQKHFVAEGQQECAPELKSSLGSASARAGSASRLNYVLSQEASKSSATKVSELLQKMEAEGWESDVMSYNIVIRSYAKQGDLKAAEQWLNRLSYKNLEPNEHSFVAIMSYLAKGDNLDATEAVMRRMMQIGIPATTMSFTMLVHACTRLGLTSRAEAFIKEMKELGISPGETHYNSLIHACSMEGNVDAAERWFRDMETHGVKATVITYTALIDACAKSSDTVRAEFWMQRMLAEALEPNVVSYSTMINACAKVVTLPAQKAGMKPWLPTMFSPTLMFSAL